MADYELGGVLINLEVGAKKSLETLDKVSKSLDVFRVSLDKISKVDISQAQQGLEKLSKLDFSGVTKALETLDIGLVKNFKSFNTQMTKLTKINFDNVDFNKLQSQMFRMDKIFKPFIKRIQDAEPSLRAFTRALDLGDVNAKLMVAEARVKSINQNSYNKGILDELKIKKANAQLKIAENRVQKIEDKAKQAKNFKQLFNLGKLYFWINYTKRLSQGLAGMVQNAINFTETLNKFQVSMGSYYDQSLQFVNNLTRAFNLSTESIMNYQSTFKNMLDALGGLGGGTSYELSETLTRMAIDYASLFNVSIDRAMQQFQSVLSGQINKPCLARKGLREKLTYLNVETLNNNNNYCWV